MPWFAAKMGVKQRCMLSPLMFLTVLHVDWIMKETTKNDQTGIQMDINNPTGISLSIMWTMSV